ncbi:uncharacterized protein LOC116718815 [Xiphophorus hellerii]|uniref:uncharacterized protein LOC116718815 n=1 Tax=Xiphophorus hellerii TaxID=8084 RepID=UPI0013B413DB|nr:uncharacterized protein LOC116718815 [Xiphophorus hellerii]XP_032416937.1 uncharacterized protein LOC116718815 [Xiphophorus hellerii]
MSQEAGKAPSTRSSKTHLSSSSKSSASMAAVNARAKAEAARTRAEFAKKEIAMKVKKAELEATLLALQHQCDAEAAHAEANVYEAAANEEEHMSRPEQQNDDSLERTGNYVKEQLVLKGSVTPFDILEYNELPAAMTFCQPKQEPDHSIDTLKDYVLPSNMSINHEAVPQLSQSNPVLKTSPSFKRDVQSKDQVNMSELTRFLARSELLTGGLRKFSDKPGDYWSWKSSFENAIRNLHLFASEELDLLIKWLGPESVKYAERLRAVHVNNPEQGLLKVWDRLQECYGSPEALERALLDRMLQFPKISNKDPHLLRELADLLLEIDSAKSEGYIPGLLYLDTARGIHPVVDKLPFGVQEKWMNHGTKYKEKHSVSFPPFSVFANFVSSEAKMRNDPSFRHSVQQPPAPLKMFKYQERHSRKEPISVSRTEVVNSQLKLMAETKIVDVDKECPIHRKPHALKRCRAFREMPFEERKIYLKKNSICFRCCASTNHQAKNCSTEISCAECGINSHVSALHPGPAVWATKPPLAVRQPVDVHGGEQDQPSPTAISTCTQVCGSEIESHSCAKICPVFIYPKGSPEKKLKTYAILDDQSNRSLARSSVFDAFSITRKSYPYMLKTCAGTEEVMGRRAHNFIVESVDCQSHLLLETLIECDMLPDNRNEIPTPEAAQHHSHLQDIAAEIPKLDPDASISLLIGRDVVQAHKVIDQRNGPLNAPFAQRLALGWVIVGDVCLGGAHKPDYANVFKTNFLDNGRPSHFLPCMNAIQVAEGFDFPVPQKVSFCTSTKTKWSDVTDIGEAIFQQTSSDEKPGFSQEERAFLQIMNKAVFQDSSNSWVAPLPFRSPRPCLPNNRQQATQRLTSVHHILNKRPKMKEHFLQFMQTILDNGHAELAPPLKEQEECWYLPFFGVYHPRKLDQIRIVFDSSARHDGLSLNDVLLTGPNLNNSLLGVLMRLREERVAVAADIKQMFHCFVVREDHRNFLRFLWHENNDMEQPIVEYRMTVHVFGNSPSPAVATYGLRRASEDQEKQDNTTRHLVERHFYVDDGLASFSSSDEAISVVKNAQQTLATSNLKLHKIASNDIDVMKAFPKEDLAKDLKDLNLGTDPPPMQSSLGISWDINTDEFTFQVSNEEKPYTRRGVLSTVNSLYDPLGFAAPVSIQGRALLRELSTETINWDDPLPERKLQEWSAWRNSLKHLEQVRIPRQYTSLSFHNATNRELCMFCDASTKAIAAVAYVKISDAEGKSELGFMFGKAKLAPQKEVTIPRLELCAAVLAIEIADMIAEEIDVPFHSTKFFTDSKVVLGYIQNESRRFYVYVCNRVQRIRKSSNPDQWNYIPTELNPADIASRSIPAQALENSKWLTGPDFLLRQNRHTEQTETSFNLVDPESDPEIRPTVTCCLTVLTDSFVDPSHFESFSSWKSLLRAIARLVHIVRLYKKENQTSKCQGWHMCKDLSPDDFLTAKRVILSSLQRKSYPELFACIRDQKEISKHSYLRKLSPYIDDSGCLRVGGRLAQANLQSDEANPYIIPSHHHLTTLLVRHYHQRVQHQGRLFTEGAVRSAGLWIIGGKRCISSVIYHCVICRKLRRNTEEQKMADLPMDRTTVAPPFTYVGVDVFGPWIVTSRRTRGGHANSKRWAVIFSCLSTRAIHVEVMESMESSSFINAFRRFVSIRGPVKQLRSDCGTNFLGACKELGITPTHCNNREIQNFLTENECTWIFNPPHASHMGGSWERMIGITKRILDSMLSSTPTQHLTHEVLVTFLAEVTAIVNSRPLTPVSSDPDCPFILTPATLLTQKTGDSSIPPGDFESGGLYRRQWRQVQHLSNVFWYRWRSQYLPTLQPRQKWQSEKPNLQVGDLVLLKDCQAKRTQWPMGIVVNTFPSQDGNVRKVEIKISSGGTCKTFLRPVTGVVLLLKNACSEDPS